MSDESNHFFSHSVNPTISGGTFTAVQGNLHIETSHSNRQGLDILLGKIAHGAFHDASERSDPPRCHPRTRKAVLDEIMKWINSPEPRRQFILWLYGPAGAGKTAIGQSIAEACEIQGLLAASFFFARNAVHRKDSTCIIATLAYQLSQYIPGIKNDIYTAIQEDPSIFSRALIKQMQRLIIQPLNAAADRGQLGSKPLAFVIIDGADECGDGSAQKELLIMLKKLAMELQHIPLLLLISSRPEFEIRRAFGEATHRHMIKTLVLDDIYDPDKDIRTYLNTFFGDIKQKYSSLGYFPSLWPEQADVSALVEKASGQFIFAATVAKYIDSPHHNPKKRLQIVLGLSDPSTDRPFATLDRLYSFILSSVANVEEVLAILTLLMLSWRSGILLNQQVDVVEDLLGFEIRRALVDMHALIFVPAQNDDVSALHVYHVSIYDFLADPSRSGTMFIDATSGHTKLAICWLKIMSNYKGSKLSRGYQANFCLNAFSRHCSESALSPGIVEHLATLDLTSMLKESNFDELNPTIWVDFSLCVKRQIGDRFDIYLRLQHQLDSFIVSCLIQYPPTLRVCIPAIVGINHSYRCGSGNDIIRLLYRAGCPTLWELRKMHKLDRRLLNLDNQLKVEDSLLAEFFCDQRRSHKYYAGGTSYIRLAKELIGFLFSKDCSVTSEIKMIDNSQDSCICSYQIGLSEQSLTYFGSLLANCAMDLEFFNLLHQHVIQYKEHPSIAEGQRSISSASAAYLKNLGFSYLEHIHHDYVDSCTVCGVWGNRAVIKRLMPIGIPIHSEPTEESTACSGRPAPLSTSSHFHKPLIQEKRPVKAVKKSRWGHLFSCFTDDSLY